MTTDITFCARECANMKCKRNLKNYPAEGTMYCSMAYFIDCKDYKEAQKNEQARVCKSILRK